MEDGLGRSASGKREVLAGVMLNSPEDALWWGERGIHKSECCGLSGLLAC